jgi:hypothetical protein
MAESSDLSQVKLTSAEGSGDIIGITEIRKFIC